jgi:hypothetical protein
MRNRFDNALESIKHIINIVQNEYVAMPEGITASRDQLAYYLEGEESASIIGSLVILTEEEQQDDLGSFVKLEGVFLRVSHHSINIDGTTFIGMDCHIGTIGGIDCADLVCIEQCASGFNWPDLIANLARLKEKYEDSLYYPMTEKPMDMQLMYLPDVVLPQKYIAWLWVGSLEGDRLLKQGLIYPTKEGAIYCADRMLATIPINKF